MMRKVVNRHKLGGPDESRRDPLTRLNISWSAASRWPFTGRRASRGVAVSFIGRDQFVTNKRSTGRTRDLADLEALGEK